MNKERLEALLSTTAKMPMAAFTLIRWHWPYGKQYSPISWHIEYAPDFGLSLMSPEQDYVPFLTADPASTGIHALAEHFDLQMTAAQQLFSAATYPGGATHGQFTRRLRGMIREEAKIKSERRYHQKRDDQPAAPVFFMHPRPVLPQGVCDVGEQLSLFGEVVAA